MKVKLDGLRRALDIVFASIESRKCQDLELDAGLYWEIAIDKRYDVTAPLEDKDIVVGSLADDCEVVQRLVSGSTEALPYDLIAIAAILRKVGVSEV